MDYATIRLDIRDAVARLTLDRPDKLNSITVRMRDELIAALEQVGSDDSVRCLLLQGAGRAFCAGQDLDERAPVVHGERIDLGETLEAGVNRIVRMIKAMPVPVVCAVHGAAAGAGANLALACDIVIASRSAKIVQSFTRIGLIPDGGGTWTLPRLVGPARASGMVLLAEPVSGEIAANWGLVWTCVADEELQIEAERIATQLAMRSPHAIASAKRALQAALANSLDDQLDLERDLQREAGYTREYQESVEAFLKRTRG